MSDEAICLARMEIDSSSTERSPRNDNMVMVFKQMSSYVLLDLQLFQVDQVAIRVHKVEPLYA